MVSEIFYAVCIVAAAAGVCWVFAAVIGALLRFAYRRFEPVRRFFDRIDFDNENEEDFEDENEAFSVHR